MKFSKTPLRSGNECISSLPDLMKQANQYHKYVWEQNHKKSLAQDIDVGFGSINDVFYRDNMVKLHNCLRVIFKHYVIEPTDFKEFVHEYIHESHKELES